MGIFRRKLSLYLAIPVVLGTACLSCLVNPKAAAAAEPEARMSAHMDPGKSCIDDVDAQLPSSPGAGFTAATPQHGSDCRVSFAEEYYEAKQADFVAIDSGALPAPIFSQLKAVERAFAAPDTYWPKINKNRLITGCVVKNE